MVVIRKTERADHIADGETPFPFVHCRETGVADLLKSMSDNQLALLGCLGALGASMLLLAVSYHSRSRPANQTSGQRSQDQEISQDQEKQGAGREQRRAA
jgi:hypothetical protein